MAQKKVPDVSPELRRKSIELDVEAYLAAGNKIEQVPSGVSSQDPNSQNRQIRLGSPKDKRADKAEETKASKD